MFQTLKTGIDGLDAVLGGGIRYPEESSCFVFVTGGAGTGKTLLAMEMLTRAWLRADNGATLLYYSVEHSPQTLHAKLTEDYDPSLPPVYGNRDQLIQVFLNLVKNAAEAVPRRQGEIRLKTSYRHGVRLALPGSSERVRLALEVTVSDNGGGIPEDLLAVIFDPFVTTKPHGSGLGLALAAKIVGDHGGLIEVDRLGRGSRVRVVLPVHEQKD